MKQLLVTFSDSSRWSIPADCIAHNRASCMASIDAAKHGVDYDEAYKAEFEFTMESSFTLLDWAANNMNWSHVVDRAVRYEHSIPINKDREWPNADKEILQ